VTAQDDDPDSAKPAIAANADKQYQTYTGQLSTIVRTLSLSAIAITWFFAGTWSGDKILPTQVLTRLESNESLLLALIFALSALFADLLQYAWASFAWGSYNWALEQILLNDGSDENLPFRARIAWLIARLCKLVRYFESVRADGGRSADRRSWSNRRQDLRQSLRTLSSTQDPRGLQNLTKALQSSWSPLVINRITAILFTVKIGFAAASYLSLGSFLI
jgi:hypothetical protein